MLNPMLIDLHDLTSKRLRNVAHSAGIDLDGATKKDEIVQKLREEKVELTSDGWQHDGEEFELQEQTSSPSDTNVLYGFRRKACTEEIIEEIQELFEDTRYEIRLGETDGGKEKFELVIPADED